MNLLEQYIVEIHSVEPCNAEWTKEFNKDFWKVVLTTECYGRMKTSDHVFDTEEWKKIKEQGYYMA